jgi:signal transduction histidine kinase/ligand-binding sensor domain-containing protein
MQRDRKLARSIWLGSVLAGLLLVDPPGAQALNPELDVSQYAHTGWKVSDGFTKGMIFTIAQTSDGYLWLGTEFGLYRFDGVHAVPWQPPTGQDLPSHIVYSLLVARDGSLWIGTTNGVASWKDGKLTHYPQVDGQMIYALREDREGTIWSGGAAGPAVPGPATLCAIGGTSVHCYGKDGSLGRGVVSSVYEDRKGDLWAVTGNGIWRWRPGPPKFYPLQMGLRPLEGFIEDGGGKLLIGIEGGLRRFLNGKIEAYPLPSTVQPFLTRTLLCDHDSGLWIAVYNVGLVHIHEGRADVFRQADGLSSDDVLALFEDRENNVWVSTVNGLDRFRAAAVATFSVKEGLSNSLADSVLADRDGSVWVATPGGIDRGREGQFTRYGKQDGKLNGSATTSLFQDSGGRIWVSTRSQFGYLEDNRFVSVGSAGIGVAQAIAEDSTGNLWIADQEEGLFRVRDNKIVERIPWIDLGHKDFALSLAADPLHGGIWLGFYEGGISHFPEGRVQETYTAADGLAKGSVGYLDVEKNGTLWASTDSGLTRVKNGHFATLSRENGLPCDAIYWMIQDDDHSFWLYTPCGLLRLVRSEMEAWTAAVDRGQGAKQMVHPTVFDASDGVRMHEVSSDRFLPPMVTKSLDGRIWFTQLDGVSVIDPHHLPFNKVPPPVRIERITADAKIYDLSNGLPLPPVARDLTIDYTALSFVVPEKVRFRYKLEGQDPEWKEVVNERQVRYTNLAPGYYTFRVIACNNDGVWNMTGASLRFSIAPAYYQTAWFRLCCVAAVLLLLWGAYLFRVRQLEAQFTVGLEARVEERTRIARDLHDTLLQSFSALLPHLQTVSNVLPSQPDEAKRRVERAIEQATNAVTEGRDTVHALRSGESSAIDLDRAISNFAKELVSGGASEPVPEIHVRVEGQPTVLNSIVRDEVYRIATEAVRNAIRHANASRIEVEIRYDEQHLRLRIGDNGTGIDPALLELDHKAGHWGLRGMRERAKLVGGTLEVWSQPNVGTEIELSIPAAGVYAKPLSVRRSLLSRLRRS